MEEKYIARSAFKLKTRDNFETMMYLAVRKLKEIINQKEKNEFNVYIDIVEEQNKEEK